jgi:hypothetical protein
MQPPMGRMIFEGIGRPELRSLFNLGLGAEMLYAFFIIVCSLMIYFGTRELYELSSHKGIKYFRQAFLFFAIAYFFRSFIKFIVIYFEMNGILEFSPATFGIFGMLTLFLFMYFSSMAIFYILYSVIWKELGSNKIFIFHAIAFVLSFVIILSRSPFLNLSLNILLLIIVIFVVYISYRNAKNKRGYNLYKIYLFLLFFWVLNIVDTIIPKFFQGLQLFIYLASSWIFLLILYKVIKRVGSD